MLTEKAAASAQIHNRRPQFPQATSNLHRLGQQWWAVALDLQLLLAHTQPCSKHLVFIDFNSLAALLVHVVLQAHACHHQVWANPGLSRQLLCNLNDMYLERVQCLQTVPFLSY